MTIVWGIVIVIAVIVGLILFVFAFAYAVTPTEKDIERCQEDDFYGKLSDRGECMRAKPAKVMKEKLCPMSIGSSTHRTCHQLYCVAFESQGMVSRGQAGLNENPDEEIEVFVCGMMPR